MEETLTDGNDFTRVMSYSSGQKDAENSFSPTNVIPLLTSQTKPYNGGTLLDSSLGTAVYDNGWQCYTIP